MNLLMCDTLYRQKTLPIISIAAVNGVAIGGGAEATTACDWRVMASDAQIKFFTMKMSVATVWGGEIFGMQGCSHASNRSLTPHRGRLTAGTYLPKLVPHHQALRLISSTLPVHPPQGLQLGFVSHIASPGQDAIQAALAFLHPVIYFDSPTETARHTIEAVREIKACMLRAVGGPEGLQKELEKEMQVVVRLWGVGENWAGELFWAFCRGRVVGRTRRTRTLMLMSG